jgi:hypothetical protein
MAERCFKEADSDPPVCGIHQVPLELQQLPRGLITEGYRGFSFFVCPVTGTVLDDPATHKRKLSDRTI